MAAKFATFDLWMREVDRRLEARCGLDSRDLEDIAYYDLYEDGATPNGAATRAIKNSGGDF